jgi:hypothetical protein
VTRRRPKVLYDAERPNGQWGIDSSVVGLPDLTLWAAPATADADSWKVVTDSNYIPIETLYFIFKFGATLMGVNKRPSISDELRVTERCACNCTRRLLGV